MSLSVKVSTGLVTTNSEIQTTAGTIISENPDYAEVREWADGNTNNEDRIGYFVAIDEATEGTAIVKATATADVRGVTVAAPAFSSNCSADKFDENGNLLQPYAYVAVMGIVSVIDDGTCVVNSRCMPNDAGIAVPSTNNFGYQVLSRIDSTHILISVEPGVDMFSRIKTDINNKAETDHTHDDRYYTESEIEAKLSNLQVSTQIYSASDTAPDNTNLFWVDTSSGGILKYYDGSAWSSIKVAWE